MDIYAHISKKGKIKSIQRLNDVIGELSTMMNELKNKDSRNVISGSLYSLSNLITSFGSHESISQRRSKVYMVILLLCLRLFIVRGLILCV